MGDKRLDEGGKPIAEIKSLGRISTSIDEIYFDNNRSLEVEEEGKKQINAKISLRCNLTEDNQLFFQGQRICQNSVIEFKTDRYTAKGQLVNYFSLADKNLEYKQTRLRVSFTGTAPELAKMIKQDDTEKNAEGKIIGRIEKILKKKPTDILVLDKKLVTVMHPFNIDTVVVLNIEAIEKGGVLYYKGYPLKVGNNICFSPELYNVTGEIIGFQDE